MSSGSNLNVPNPDVLNVVDLQFLPEQQLEEALAREYAQTDTVLAAHSWITPQLRWMKPPVRDNRVSNLVGFPVTLRPVLHAVPADFGQAVRSEFLKLSYNRNGRDEDVFKELNKRAGVKPTAQPDVSVLVPSSIDEALRLEIYRTTEFPREFGCVFPTGIQGERDIYLRALQSMPVSQRCAADTTSLNENLYGAFVQYNQVYDAKASAFQRRNIPFVARPQAFAVKVPAFFASGLSTAIIAPLMLVGVQTYTDLVNIGNAMHRALCACLTRGRC